MVDEKKRFTLRINLKLFEQVKAKAIKEKRAIGRQIEFMLDEQINKTK